MRTKKKKIIKILNEINSLLMEYDEREWEKSIKNFTSNLMICSDSEFSIISRGIHGIYGGMGSFSDLVLYKKGLNDFKDNEKLNSFRKKLFDLIIKSL